MCDVTCVAHTAAYQAVPPLRLTQNRSSLAYRDLRLSILLRTAVTIRAKAGDWNRTRGLAAGHDARVTYHKEGVVKMDLPRFKGGILTALAVGLFLVGAAPLQRQQPVPRSELDNMHARLERLERENQELTKKIQFRQLAEEQQIGVLYQPPAGQSLVGEAMSEAAVKKIVSDYLKQQKEEEENKKKGYQELTNKPPLNGKWDNGWTLQSPNKDFTIRAGVEAQADAVWMHADDAVKQVGNGGVGPVTDGTNIRRGRLDVKGTMYETFEYQMQYDFNLGVTVRNAAGTGPTVINSPQPTEFWGMFKHLPLVRQIRIGNQKPLWSFENWTSSRFQDFMERSLGWDAFAEDQNNGFLPSICMLNWTEDERMTFQAGLGKNNRSGFFYNTQPGNYIAEGRFSFNPWYEDNGRFMLHLGLGGMIADTSNGVARFRSRTLLRNGSNQNQPIMTEARMLADRESRLVPEFAMNLGRWYVQAEYYMAWATNARTLAAPGVNLGTWSGHAYYVQLMYFITGEYKPYNRHMGRYERIIPHTNFYWTKSCGNTCFGSGCWLTGVRYSYVNLNDKGGVNGAGAGPSGAMPSSAAVSDVSWVVNWIMNPNARMMFDTIFEHREAANTPQSNGNLVGFGMRMQFDY